MIPTGSIPVPSKRVLLIENSPSDRLTLRNWLAAGMIEIHEAVDIITGLAVCEKVQPNLILLQLRLHTFDGYEVIKRLKNDPKMSQIPVIFLANSALTAEKAKGIDMGAVDFVSKPYDSVELLARVNSALRTKALLELLSQRAHLDGLTELGNRFALQDALPLQTTACREKRMPLSVVIADLDHFKRVNDHYGHAAGDEVLRRVAMVLRCATRPTDFLARYGGEEFVALCPDCPRSLALEMADRVRQGVADLRVLFRNQLIRMTTSVGVAHTFDDVVADPAELLDRADTALYRAKASGRDAVWYWEPALQKPVPAAPRGAAEPDPAILAEPPPTNPAPPGSTRRFRLRPGPRPPEPAGPPPPVPSGPEPASVSAIANAPAASPSDPSSAATSETETIVAAP